MHTSTMRGFYLLLFVVGLLCALALPYQETLNKGFRIKHHHIRCSIRREGFKLSRVVEDDTILKLPRDTLLLDATDRTKLTTDDKLLRN